MLPALGLSGRLRRTDDDVTDIEGAVGVAGELPYSQLTLRAPDGLAERQHIRRPVLLPVPQVELSHVRVADEGHSDPCVGRQRIGLRGAADGATDRPEVARRLAAERESQVPDALVGGGVAAGRRAMRSSGYGIRSCYTPARSSRNAPLTRCTSRGVRSQSSS